jgi:transglutaminase-like putative cysteine protease
MRSLRVTSALGPSFQYSLTAVVPEIAPADLVGLGTDYPDNAYGYLKLPFPRVADLEGPDTEATWRATVSEIGAGGSDWVELYALNDRIIGDATDPYQIALRIERHLRQFFSYSLEPPASDYSSPYAAFLFDTRSGYCQHFAGAMALLLRYNGIPSRVAVGFATGEPESPGVYLVSRNNAHAWVEAYFPTVGWVAFDPTPGRSLPTTGASSTSPGFINPFTESGTSGSATVVTEPPRENLPGTGEKDPDKGAAETGSWWSRATWLPWVAALLALAIVWPAVLGLWRRRQLHRGPWEQRLQASLGLLRAELSEYGAPVTSAQTLEELLGTVQTHVGLEPDLGLVDRAEAVLFGGRRARQADFKRAELLRSEVKTRLRRRHGWVRTGLVCYGLPRFRT